jgi:transcriptional regulator
MYLPAYATQTDRGFLFDFMEAHAFGTLTTFASGELGANHYPFLLERADDGSATLVTHLARANPQWRALESGAPCLVVFQGPHAYISPAFYVTTPQVPTWNYTAVHASGVAEVIQDPADIEDILVRTVERFEGERDEPWRYEIPADFKAQLTRAIVGVRIRVRKLEGKFKLSQNRSAEDYAGVVRAMERFTDDNSRALLEYMRRTAPKI